MRRQAAAAAAGRSSRGDGGLGGDGLAGTRVDLSAGLAGNLKAGGGGGHLPQAVAGGAAGIGGGSGPAIP